MEVQAPPTDRGRPFLLTGEGWPYLLVPLIPVAIVLEFMHADAVLVFFASALGVIPTAALMGRATEELAARSEEHTSELQSRRDLVCRLLLEKKKDRPHRRYLVCRMRCRR